jgi:hypothetical protein
MCFVIRLVQLRGPSRERRVAMVDGSELRPIAGYESTYALVLAAIEAGRPFAEFARAATGDTNAIAYDPVYRGDGEWRLLPAFDHPIEPARCLVTGTGLTHQASAANRQAMHANQQEWTDSMRMYQWGVDGGRPAPASVGVAPEWFYKGCGTVLRAHREPLTVPAFAEDGGEEPEIAGAYVIDAARHPRRVGMMMGNEFSDHRLEKRNYLYLAHSKLRTCAVGPELVVDADFNDVRGTVSIERGGSPLWSQAIASGEAHMCHSLANLEHHHFKYPEHRRPGDAHIHFFGASAFSFGAGITLEDGDEMVVAFEGFGRPLRNPVRVERGAQELVAVLPV